MLLSAEVRVIILEYCLSVGKIFPYNGQLRKLFAQLMDWKEKNAGHTNSCFDKLPNMIDAKDVYNHEKPAISALQVNRILHIEGRNILYTQTPCKAPFQT